MIREIRLEECHPERMRATFTEKRGDRYASISLNVGDEWDGIVLYAVAADSSWASFKISGELIMVKKFPLETLTIKAPDALPAVTNYCAIEDADEPEQSASDWALDIVAETGFCDAPKEALYDELGGFQGVAAWARKHKLLFEVRGREIYLSRA